MIFWDRVDMTAGPDGCWLWQGPENGLGYGRFYDGPLAVYAHRWAYELLVGPIPEGLELDHLCRIPACVNPRHLEPVTHRENILRGMAPAAIAVRTNLCRRGHDLAGARVRAGHRQCRPCQAAFARERRTRLAAERAA